MKASEFLPVKRTSAIHFDEQFKTFRLTTQETLYAFCISPESTLEHLYWGKKVKDGFDLRYLSNSCRMEHFNAVEIPSSFEGKIIIEADTMEDVKKVWKENLNKKSDIINDIDIRKKRIENLSWRVLSKSTVQDNESKVETLGGNNSLESEEYKQHYTRPRSSSLQSYVRHQNKVVGNEETNNIKFSKAKTTDDLDTLSNNNNHASYEEPIDINVKGKVNHHSNLQTFQRQAGKVGKGMICTEYSDHGTGDFRSPSFSIATTHTGSNITPLRYKDHAIYRGKLPMPDRMPAIRCVDDDEASTLVITLEDKLNGTEVDLVYVVMHEFDCITRRTVFRNINDNYVMIAKASSVTIDLESSHLPYYLVQLSGSWAKERYIVESKLQMGMQSFGSTRGVSSHHQNPFAVITEGEPNEILGETKAFSLVYSGNFLFEAEINEMSRLRVNMGIHPMGLQWKLRPGCYFATPEAILVRSEFGLGGITRTLHRLFLERLIPRNWSDDDPPIILNTWEAKFYDVTHENIIEMVKQAVDIGVNLIVVDDGWYGRRKDDKSGLGDWYPNPKKFPHGLEALSVEINKLGCKFGLWFEPEMVSEESSLFAAHPDWYLHLPGRPRQLGRNQMVLDLSRSEVVDYLFNTLSSIISKANVEYIKWDMNRPLTDTFSASANHFSRNSDAEIWQSEISHRYVLGLYTLQERLMNAFPNVLLENCASGGGRLDPGMLYYSAQIWCSDNTDAIVRMKIQYGSSLVYPARTLSAHVSPVPNILTGNTSRLRTRGFVAMSGVFGYELDISQSSESELQAFKEQIRFYKQIVPCVHWGDFYRLWSPFKINLAAWMFVKRDKSEAVVFAFSVNSDHWSNLVPRLKLQGLDPHAVYEVTEPFPNNVTQSTGYLMIIESEVPIYQMCTPSVLLAGDVLMNVGLPVKFYTLDDSTVFLLRMIDSSH